MSTSWIIASGKGGVGKSTISAGLGVAMAREGRSVCIVDADIGLRDQDVMLGLENSVVFDVFPYRGGLFKQSAHGENANVLRLGGDVESFNIKPAASASNIWNWIGEYMDGIEL